MRWFKKKPLPFDDHFSIDFFYDPTTVHLLTHFWTVPYNYYAQLINAHGHIFTSGLGSTAVVLLIEVFRGTDIIHTAIQSQGIKRGDNVHVILAVGAKEFTSGLRGGINIYALPDYMYLYPGDVVNMRLHHEDPGDYFHTITYTLKTWETS